MYNEALLLPWNIDAVSLSNQARVARCPSKHSSLPASARSFLSGAMLVESPRPVAVICCATYEYLEYRQHSHSLLLQQSVTHQGKKNHTHSLHKSSF